MMTCGPHLPCDQQSTICSSDPGTPWLLADYLVDMTQSESSGDKEKHVHAVAQVDLFLCSDQQCNEVGDIQHVKVISPHAGDVCDKQMALGLSTLLGTVLVAPLGTASDVATAEVQAIDNHSKAASGYNMTVKEVIYKSSTPSLWHVNGPEPLLDPMPMGVMARLFAAYNSGNKQALKPKWPLMYGAYKATVVYSEWDKNSYPLMEPFVTDGGNMPECTSHIKCVMHNTSFCPNTLSGWRCQRSNASQCVVLILPVNNKWMNDHGWNESDADCMSQVNDTTPVYIFDSYFYQAQFLNGRAELGPLGVGSDNAGLKGDCGADVVSCLSRRLNYTNITMQPPYNTSVDVVNDTASFLDAQPGTYGLTSKCPKELGLSVASSMSCKHFTTQQRAGCLTGSSNCVVLAIGSATILARVVPFAWSDGKIPLVMPTNPRSSSPEYRSGLQLLALSVQRDDMAKQGQYSRRPPWCELPWSPHDAFFQREDACFKELSGGDCLNLTDVFIFGSQPSNESLHPCFRKSLARDCDWWDKQGVGYARRPGSKQPTQSNRPLLELFQPRWFLLGVSSTYTSPDCKQDEQYKYDTMVLGRDVGAYELHNFVQQSADGIVQNVRRLLVQQVVQELALTESTVSLFGCLAALGLTLVSIVAMAAGLKDMYELFGDLLSYCTVCFAHILSSSCGCGGLDRSVQRAQIVVKCGFLLLLAMLVLVGIVLPPALALGSFNAALARNARGDESRVGWLQGNTMGNGAFVVVAAVSMAFDAQPPQLDLVRCILTLTLALAVVACVFLTACIGYLVFPEVCTYMRSAFIHCTLYCCNISLGVVQHLCEMMWKWVLDLTNACMAYHAGVAVSAPVTHRIQMTGSTSTHRVTC